MPFKRSFYADNRVIFVSLVVVGVLIAGLYATSSLILLKSYDRLEKQELLAAGQRARNAFDNAGVALTRTAVDYSAWDDAYDFALDPSSRFLAENCTPDSMKNLDIDFMAVVEPAGGQVRGRQLAAAQVGGLDARVSSALMVAFAKPAPIARHALLSAASRHYLVASSPITPSTGSPRSGSYLIVGRLVDAGLAAQLSKLASLRLKVAPAPPSFTLPIETVKSGVGVDFIDSNSARATVYLRPIGTGRTLAMSTTLPRNVRKIGVRSLSMLQYALIFFAVVSTASIGHTFWLQHQEVVARTRAEDTLRASEERHRTLLEHMPDAVLGVTPLGHLTYGNPEAEKLTGRSAAELMLATIWDLLDKKSAKRVRKHMQKCATDRTTLVFEVTMLHSSGARVPVEVNASPVVDENGRVAYLQWIARDVTERKRFEEELVALATHDHLTGLDNRRTFENQLRKTLKQAVRTGKSGALLWLDADCFKDVNDTLGHQVGDLILVGIGEAIADTLRPDAYLARMGGDEFAILLPEVEVEEALECGKRVLETVRTRSWQFDAREVAITASMGVVMFPEHGSTAEDVLARADLAMYYSKEHDKNRLTVYRPGGGWEDERALHLQRTSLINHALADATFVVHAQPIVDLTTGRICHHELLIRIASPDGRLLMPSEFLPVAEKSGQIREIDRWMVQEATRIIVQELEPSEECKVYINLSARAFTDPELLPLIEQQVQLAGINPALIGFEITETAAVADMGKARDFITGLKRLGCHVSLDDFGSGFSSFYYLKNLPVDSLKIDGSFIQNLVRSPEDRHIVSAIVELSRGFGIVSVAECIENAETLELVRRLGVDRGQGYHLGRPAPVADALGHHTPWSEAQSA